MAGAVTVRRLFAEEWERLSEIYESQQDRLPPAEQNTAIVAEVDGQIVGMFGLNLILHAGPLWVDPEWRGKGVADQMGRALEDLARESGSKGFLMFPSNQGAERVAVRLGLERTELKVFKREF